jgi:heme-degrading monooxygenase HmoA
MHKKTVTRIFINDSMPDAHLVLLVEFAKECTMIGNRLSPTTDFYRRRLNMITVGMNYHVIEGKQQDFENKFAAVIDALEAAEGHSSSTLWKDVSDNASYLITSEWSEEQAFTDFIRSDAFRAVTNWGKEQILSGRPQHKIYKQ